MLLQLEIKSILKYKVICTLPYSHTLVYKKLYYFNYKRILSYLRSGN